MRNVRTKEARELARLFGKEITRNNKTKLIVKLVIARKRMTFGQHVSEATMSGRKAEEPHIEGFIAETLKIISLL
jgi:hypothetical protein